MRKHLKKAVMVLVTVAIFFTPSAIDYKCMNDCLAQGYLYQYCQRVCSY